MLKCAFIFLAPVYVFFTNDGGRNDLVLDLAGDENACLTVIGGDMNGVTLFASDAHGTVEIEVVYCLQSLQRRVVLKLFTSDCDRLGL
jgi:hypothetical protein